jgi:O-antigen/teichoic acid export membrane protein
MAATGSDLSIDGLPAAEGREHTLRPATTPIVPATVEQFVTPHLESSVNARTIRPRQPTEVLPGKSAEAGQRVARNLGALMGGQAVTWTLTLIWTLIVPRAIGPVGFGLLVSAQSVSSVLGIALALGARDYLVRETVVAPAAGPRLVGTVFALRIALAPAVGLAAILWARLAHYGHDATLVLYAITVMTIFVCLLEPLQAVFQAIERMKYIAYGNVINKVAQSVAGIALIVIGFKVVAIAVEMAVIVGLVVLLSWWWLRPHFKIDVKTNVTLIARVARESLAYFATGFFGMIYLWIDTIMLTLMTRSAVVGWYGAATQLFQTLMFMPVLVQTAWLPRLVAAFGNSRRELHETARAPMELVLMLSLPIAASTVVVAEVLIRGVFGSEFAHAVPVLIILALCIPPIYVNIILAAVLVAEKRQAAWAKVMTGAAVFNPLVNLVLIPVTEHRYHNGAIGAAISLVLTELLMDGVGLLLVGRHVFDRRIVKRCALMCLASTGMVAVALISRPLGTVTSFAAGFATLGALVLVLRIVSPEERALARLALARAQARVTRKRPGRVAETQ